MLRVLHSVSVLLVIFSGLGPSAPRALLALTGRREEYSLYSTQRTALVNADLLIGSEYYGNPLESE